MTEYIRRGYIRKMAMLESVYTMETEHDRETVLRLIEDAPTSDVALVVHGRWIVSHDEFCSCSLCKYPVYAAWNQTNYCPNCGAKMDGDKNE